MKSIIVTYYHYNNREVPLCQISGKFIFPTYNISQGIVATCLRNGGIFNDGIIAYFLDSVKMEFLKYIWYI